MSKKQCTVDGCERKRYGGDYCRVHKHRMDKHGSVEPVPCSVLECERPSISKGFCSMHVQRFDRHGSTDEIIRVVRVCDVDGCGRVHKSNGFCSLHVDRLYRTGTTDVFVASRGDGVKFLRSILNTESDDCIEWPFGRHTGGYGSIDIGGKKMTASRAILIMKTGESGKGFDSSHSCGNRICVNVSHLRWATRKENNDDMDIHGTRLVGSACSYAKLTESQVLEIRDRYASGGITYCRLAEEYGVSAGAITGVVLRLTWKHI